MKEIKRPHDRNSEGERSLNYEALIYESPEIIELGQLGELIKGASGENFDTVTQSVGVSPLS